MTKFPSETYQLASVKLNKGETKMAMTNEQIKQRVDRIIEQIEAEIAASRTIVDAPETSSATNTLYSGNIVAFNYALGLIKLLRGDL